MGLRTDRKIRIQMGFLLVMLLDLTDDSVGLHKRLTLIGKE